MWVDESANGEPERSDDPFQWVNDFVQRTQQSGSFAYDEPTLSRIADRWQRIADKCEKAYEDAHTMVQIVGPAADPASRTMADKANASGRAYLNMVSDLQAYCRSQADHCKQALGIYNEEEGSNSGWLKKFTPFPDSGQAGGVL